jgi:hypothetical protein
MGRTILAARGEHVSGFSGPEQLLLRMLTTGDLPNLLTGTGNRALMTAFEAAASPLRQLARQSTAADLRNKTGLRVATTGLLERVAEHGEVRHGGFTETKETYKIDTYRKIVSAAVILTRVADWNLTHRLGLASSLGRGPDGGIGGGIGAPGVASARQEHSRDRTRDGGLAQHGAAVSAGR